MHGLDVIIRRNNQATERELNDAVEAGDINLALRIADAVIGDALAKGVEASWPGYTPEAQAYELATRVDGCDPDGIAHLLPRQSAA